VKYIKERVMLRPKPVHRYQAEGGREEGMKPDIVFICKNLQKWHG
jgi:hypothetical protein